MTRRWRLLPVFLFAVYALCARHPLARGQTPPEPAVYGDDRFGVNLIGDPQQLLTLGTRWYINVGVDAAPPPPGAVSVQPVPVGARREPAASLSRRVAVLPGSYWLIGNEPNVTGGEQELSGADYARAYREIAVTILAADPSAKLVAPNIINFDFTCISCPGYLSGHAWMDGFLAAYTDLFGGLPPVDVWAIHTYPLDFDHLPQTDAALVEDQLRQFRDYLDAVPGLAGAPIWDTELGTHWGYEGLEWRDDGSGKVKAFPVGEYRGDLLLNYMQDVLGWLAGSGPALHIDRWFFFVTYMGQPEAWETVYGGINLLDGSGHDAALTPFGRLYRQFLGLTP